MKKNKTAAFLLALLFYASILPWPAEPACLEYHNLCVGDVTGDNTSSLSGVNSITGGGASPSISGFDITFSDNTINGVKIIDNTIAPIKMKLRGVLAVDTTGQTMTSANTYYALMFRDADKYDTDSMHSITTDNTLVVIPSGVTMIRAVCGAQVSSTASGVRVRLYKNGSSYEPPLVTGYSSSDNVVAIKYPAFSSPPLPVVAGDNVACYIHSNGAGDQTLTAYFGVEVLN